MTDGVDEALPVVDPSAVEPSAGQTRIAGLLLAAGESARFEDGNKLLSAIDGEPIVWHAALTLVQAGLDPRVAIVGHEGDAVESALSGLGFEIVHNPDYAEGQATSLRRGIDAIESVDAVVIALGDMPAVDPGSSEALVDVYRAGAANVLAAAYEGQRGNPVLFDRQFFDALATVEGDTGGRELLLDRDDAALVETGDPGVLQDVDTRADLERVREAYD